MLLRLVDFLKANGTTALLSALTRGSAALEETTANISSLVDCWLLLRDIESGGERNRGLYVLKARGLAHSNQIREFLLTSQGIQLREVYLGEAGLLTGSARVAKEAQDATAGMAERQELERRQAAIERKRKAIEAQIAMLQLELGTEDDALQQLAAQQQARAEKASNDTGAMAKSRSADRPDSPGSIGAGV
jgi:circadian clock protein KaiC